ncbi:ROK family protein [bacterium]|nr:ROK family protein [bacterium]
MFLGIEIGGTKLQLGVGRGDGAIAALWRGTVDPAAAGEGIRRQIVAAVPELLAKAGLGRSDLKGVGVGFGGPTDDDTQRVIKSHHVAGWDDFPLAAWLADAIGLSTVIVNDADVAGLAEALFGAGRGLSPVFYMTVGTGIGGGLTIDGEMYRGCGRGAVEIGHLRVRDGDILESYAAGWGIEARANRLAATDPRYAALRSQVGRPLTGKDVAAAARAGDPAALDALDVALDALTEALQQMIKLLCPRRVVIGGGVSLTGDELFFDPLRRRVATNAFPPFAGLTDIVPAALGEEVVVHGALALARQRLGR